MDYKKRIIEIVQTGVSDIVDREILANSMFYYCCGKDPTPIIALGDMFPLYVYVDTINYGKGDFIKETSELYHRLEIHQFHKLDMVHNGSSGVSLKNNRPIILQSEITEWVTGNNTNICLLYIQGDASSVFRKMYADNNNFIQPGCICNFRYELMPFDKVQQSMGDGILNHVEKRSEYIMGHCYYEDKYQKIGEYKYYGDYDGNHMSMFKRVFYYVF